MILRFYKIFFEVNSLTTMKNKLFFYFIFIFMFFCNNRHFNFILYSESIRQPIRSKTIEADNDYLKLEMLIRQIHNERETYYKNKNEWNKEKLNLKHSINNMKSELSLLKINISDETDNKNELKERLTSLEKILTNDENLNDLYLPILNKSLNELKKYIISGLPFHLNERLDKVLSLKVFIDDITIPIDEKFRRVWNFYMSEIDYSTTNEIYTDKIQIENEKKVVNILRVGTIGMYYKTNDNKEFGMIIQKNNGYNWHKIENQSFISSIDDAFNIVERSKVATILNLPFQNFKNLKE